MSSRVFAERRGILANAVAEKARGYSSKQDRSLLFFLQGLSMRFGGTHSVATDILRMFPSRICEERLPEPTSEELTRDLAAYLSRQSPSLQKHASDSDRAARFFAELIVDLCVNPAVDLPELRTASASLEYFVRDPIGTIEEYKKRYEADIWSRQITTSIGEQVHAALDSALRTSRLLNKIPGKAGTGKTTAAEQWVDAHLGEARFVKLTGITNRTTLFRLVASAVGLSVCQRSPAKLQASIESFLETSKLMIVFDEAHYLWPQFGRSRSSPELINWVNTALVNQRVPVALITTGQFDRLQAHVEQWTGWTSDQLIHRTRCTPLPNRPTVDDIKQVADFELRHAYLSTEEKWVFDASITPKRLMLEELQDYAISNDLPLPAIRGIVDEARSLAIAGGRSIVSMRDFHEAESRHAISDAATRTSIDEAKRSPDRRRRAVLPICAFPVDAIRQEEQMSNFPSSHRGDPQSLNGRTVRPARFDDS